MAAAAYPDADQAGAPPRRNPLVRSAPGRAASSGTGILPPYGGFELRRQRGCRRRDEDQVGARVHGPAKRYRRRRYKPSERADRSGALYVGRLAPHKNLPLLIDGFSLAAERGFAGELVIAGDGPARAEIEEHARRSSVADRIKVVGPVTEDRKIELLSCAAVLGMPSTREGFPRVITEAMASGLPVVTPTYAENGAKDVVAPVRSRRGLRHPSLPSSPKHYWPRTPAGRAFHRRGWPAHRRSIGRISLGRSKCAPMRFSRSNSRSAIKT